MRIFNLYLDETQFTKLRALAKKRRVSIAAIVRYAVEVYLTVQK